MAELSTTSSRSGVPDFVYPLARSDLFGRYSTGDPRSRDGSPVDPQGSWVLPIITAVVIFRFLTLPNIGLINIVLTAFGLGSYTRNWFGDPAFAFLLVLLMHLWRNVPFYGIAFMAAMQAIPQDLYEAATIDGASRWKRFWHITLPNLRYIILVMVVLHVTFTLNNFDFVYLSTGGGPVNATEVLATYIYKQAWSGYMLGYASAGGVIMLVVLVLLVFLSRKLIGGFTEQ
jgi:ABC-type sugar transport system permease subunit